MKKATLLLAGIALAASTTVAFAAKPALTHQQKQDIAAKAKKKMAATQATQPRNQAEARLTKKTTIRGTEVRVPTDLWNTLAATKNADGSIRVVDTDGTDGTTTPEGLPNE